ncbi:site-specific integrase [Actinoallomurus sp. NPDC052308]|uniref:site-specific integrase n=1 Tax=Actinoallomurus sp. NPDC052308 TaxID=3155530 RepID=UPI0034471E90
MTKATARRAVRRSAGPEMAISALVPTELGERQWSDVLAIAAKEPVRNRVMLALAYDAALRREELCSLPTDDPDPAHRTLRIRAETTKNRLERVVPYSAATGVLLSSYLAHRARISRAWPVVFVGVAPQPGPPVDVVDLVEVRTYVSDWAAGQLSVYGASRRPGTAELHSYAAGSTPAMATLHKIATKEHPRSTRAAETITTRSTKPTKPQVSGQVSGRAPGTRTQNLWIKSPQFYEYPQLDALSCPAPQCHYVSFGPHSPFLLQRTSPTGYRVLPDGTATYEHPPSNQTGRWAWITMRRARS